MRSIVRSHVARSVLVLTALGAGALIYGSQAGCSSSGGSGPAPEPNTSTTAPAADNTGSVGMQLTLPGGEQLNSVTWTVTGPNGASTVVQTNTVSVANSTTISFLIGGIPAGSNYSIFLTGTSADGTATCAGTATFNTAARTTTNVSVVLQCNTTTPQAGSALVTANTFNCGQVTSISASPAEVIVGNTIALTSSATGPNAGGLTYAWSAPSGTFSNASASNPSFTCATPGMVALTLTVSDGAVPPGSACSMNTSSITVACDGHLDAAQAFVTATKIKHLIVIFGENISFDHYFGTYPVAQNNTGEPPFSAAPGTPTPNNLSTPLDPTHGFAPLAGLNLLTNNPNKANALNGTGALNPLRLNAANAATADQGHNYLPEQEADDLGAMDLFPKYTGSAGPPPDAGVPGATTKGLVMAYFDGNVLGTYWSWAQAYALNDNSWTTNFGPSTPGALNLISGQINGISATNHTPSTSHAVADGFGGLTLIGDADPLNDVCSGVNDSASTDQVSMSGQNIGNLLNAKGVSWGWFEGGFDLTIADTGANSNGLTGCSRSTQSQVPGTTASPDYIQHHAPFQYYASTANPMHTRPTSDAVVGTSGDVANHNYDSHDFFDALSAGNLPAVVYLKAPAYQDGHPGYSDPIDEQAFAASVVTALQNAQEWSATAVVIHYDDSDGWYDHQLPPIVNASQTVSDALYLSPPTRACLGSATAERSKPAAAERRRPCSSDRVTPELRFKDAAATARASQ